MRDNKIRPDIHDDVLRRHAAGPEYWHFAIPDCDAVPKIRLVNIYTPNHFRISDMDRAPWTVASLLSPSLPQPPDHREAASY